MCPTIWSLLCLCFGFAVVARSSPHATKTRRTVPSGFVTTNGNQFELDGKPFNFVGANSYWLPLLTSSDDVETTFQGIKDQGIKVVRTWGFNAINGSELAGAAQSGLTYYQVWNSSQWILNDGPQGLQRLDNVVQTATKHDIRLIVTFTNNWVGYGGSDLFLNWMIGSSATHDMFFTNKDVMASYQSYVKTIVERYRNSSAIFAWELMNEARCLSDTLAAGPNCVPGSGTLNTWYQIQSDFVRSLDPDHMITTGGEGMFFWAQPPLIFFNGTATSDYNFDGRAGEDFELDLRLSNIDFGVYHMYPESWYPQLDFPGSNFSIKQWGLDWMQAHVDTADMVGKPVVLEEFGLQGLDNKSSVYPSWVQRALDTHHAVMPWQFGQLNLTESGGNRLIKYSDMILDGASPNDGLAIYTNQSDVLKIFTNAAKVMNARSG